MTVALVIGLAVTLVFVGTFGMATTIRNIELSKAMQLIRERMFAARLGVVDHDRAAAQVIDLVDEVMPVTHKARELGLR